MNDYKVWLGILSLVIGFAAFIPYLLDIRRGKTKPHAFSWMLWGILQTIGVAAQIYDSAGPGAWANALTALFCYIIAGIAFYQREIKFARFDWIALIGAFLAIIAWVITKSPFYSVILITVADIIAFLPTFRKAYHLPFTETLTEYALSSLKEMVALLALANFTFITSFYIGSLAITNFVFVMMILTRRNKM